MKSIVEEASSIIKAIEKGWAKAGQPKEFSVKIFEEPQRNFIGITTRSAKIGIFFNDSAVSSKPSEPSKPKLNPQAHVKSPHRYSTQGQKAIKPPVKHKEQKSDEQLSMPYTREAQEARPTIWSDAMLEDIKQWLTKTLDIMQIPAPEFTVEPHHFQARIMLKGTLLPERERERQLFASLAVLLMQMLRHHYKRPLKGYKILFINNTANTA